MALLAAVTGFGAFERVSANPSAPLARGLERRPPPGWRVVGRELPVSFARGPAELDLFLAGLEPAPDLLLALGVHKRPGFRLELCARGAPVTARARRDADGCSSRSAAPEPGDYRSSLPVADLAQALAARTGERAWCSEDAGGYVCERVYHRLLWRAHERALPALFVHVPPLRHAVLERQERVVHELFALLALHLGARAPG